VSEQQAEATQGSAQESTLESGSLSAGSTVSHSAATPGEAAAAVAMSVLESPAIAPDHEAPPKTDPAKADLVKADPIKAEPVKVEAAKSEAPRNSGKMLIMAPGDRTWHDPTAAEVKSDTRASAPQAAPKRNLLATAAMLAAAVVAGAIGGALATTSLTHVADTVATPQANNALEASIARIDADIVALKAGLDHTTKAGTSQFSKTSDRLDRIERAQAEPAAKLAKLTEAVDKLRSAAPASPAVAAGIPAIAPPGAARDVTGSVTPQAVAAATPAPVGSHTPEAPPRPEVGRMPTVEGWSLREVGYGGALIQNRRGTFEVYAGDYIPGVGRIDAIRKQTGQWVVVTSKGLIVRN
jgi:hypothetical protein